MKGKIVTVAALATLFAKLASAQSDGLPLHKDPGVANAWAPKEVHQYVWTDKTGSERPSSIGSSIFVPFVSGKLAGHIIVLGAKGSKPGISAGVAGAKGRFTASTTFNGLSSNAIEIAPGIIVDFGRNLSGTYSNVLGKRETGTVGALISKQLRQEIFGSLTPEEISAGIRSLMQKHPEWTAGIEVTKKKATFGFSVTPKSKKAGLQFRKGFGKTGSTYFGLTGRYGRGAKPTYTAEFHFVPKAHWFKPKTPPRGHRR